MKIATFDMDGTLANVDHRRHLVERQPGEKRDFEAFYQAMGKDTINQDVAAIAKALKSAGWRIYICTGRPQMYWDLTYDWLNENGFSYDSLFMRPDSQRFVKDCDVKAEMLGRIKWMHVDKIEEMVAFDDRDQVVKMWRDNGVRCFQVAEGAF